MQQACRCLNTKCASTRWSTRSNRRSITQRPWPSIRSSRRAKRGQTRPRPNTRRWSPGRRTISPPATPSRSCCRNGSQEPLRPSGLRPLSGAQAGQSVLDHTAAMAVDPLVKAGEARSNTTEDEYKAMVARAKNYIAAGDAFQIVLSQRFTSRFDLPAFALYRALRRVNPSPISASSTSAASRSSAPVPKSWCASVTARLSSARSPAPARAEKAQRKTRRWRPSSWPIRRSAPNISCCSTSAATTSAASPRSARSRSPIVSSSSATAT